MDTSHMEADLMKVEHNDDRRSPSLERRALLVEDSVNMSGVDSFFPLERYYESSDILFDKFQEAYTKKSLDIAYVYGKRYCHFVLDGIPKHEYFLYPNFRERKVQASKRCDEVLSKISNIIAWMDEEEIEVVENRRQVALARQRSEMERAEQLRLSDLPDGGAGVQQKQDDVTGLETFGKNVQAKPDHTEGSEGNETPPDDDGYPADGSVISKDQVQAFRNEFENDVAAKIAQNACRDTSVHQITMNRDIIQGSGSFTFNTMVNLGDMSVTNQKSSGRCWLFASLNLLRIYAASKTLQVRDFEYSQAYIHFYDKLEKANAFLQAMIETSDKPLDDRTVSSLSKNTVSVSFSTVQISFSNIGILRLISESTISPYRDPSPPF